MATTMGSSAVRPQSKSRRSDLDTLKAAPRNIRIDSESLRITPMETVKGDSLTLVDTARMRVGLSKEAMALTAGCAPSALSEALSGQRGNFAVQWLVAQDDAFIDAFTTLLRQKRGLSAETTKAIKAARIGELVRLLVEDVA